MASALILPETIEALRDQSWRRDAVSRIDGRAGAESFIEEVGFCNALTDQRHSGPSLFIAVCGRRDAHLPRNVQKDPECRLTWTIKDEVIRRGRIYYAKLVRARTIFIAPRLVPAFNAIWGVPKNREASGSASPADANRFSNTGMTKIRSTVTAIAATLMITPG